METYDLVRFWLILRQGIQGKRTLRDFEFQFSPDSHIRIQTNLENLKVGFCLSVVGSFNGGNIEDIQVQHDSRVQRGL